VVEHLRCPGGGQPSFARAKKIHRLKKKREKKSPRASSNTVKALVCVNGKGRHGGRKKERGSSPAKEECEEKAGDNFPKIREGIMPLGKNTSKESHLWGDRRRRSCGLAERRLCNREKKGFRSLNERRERGTGLELKKLRTMVVPKDQGIFSGPKRNL